MVRVALDLENKADLKVLNAVGWKIATGLVPGEPNQGLVAELKECPARLPGYDDSKWQVGDLQQKFSKGFTFAWYRLKVTIPEKVKGVDISGRPAWFEINADNYGEIYVDGEIDGLRGVITGYNVCQRVKVADKAEPGRSHSIAVLVANGPLGKPNGTIFMRFATLAFE